MCEINLGSTLSTFAINRQVGCHERLVYVQCMVYVATHENSLMSCHYTA